MNFKTDSEETYCSEVEELMKLTPELNNSCGSSVPVRRSQRLSQKPLIDYSIYENISGRVTRKCLRTKQQPPETKEVLKVDCLLQTTQDVFSTQDLREARDLALTNLTCKQQTDIISIVENNEPLNLSMKNMGCANDILFSQKLREHTDASLKNLKGNKNLTIPIFPEKDKVLGTLNVSLISKRSQEANSSLKTLNESEKTHLSCASNKNDIDLQRVSVQDFQQNHLNQNISNEPNTKQSKPSNICKHRGRPRKTFNTKQQNNKNLNKSFATNAKPNELEYGQSETTQNLSTKSILPDYQLSPEAVLNRPLVTYPITITPENTQLYELVDSSSTLGFGNDILFSHKLKENTDASLKEDLQGNVNVTVPIFPEKDKILGTLNVSLKSKRSQQANSSLQTLNGSEKPHLSYASNKDDIDLQRVSVQDFQQNQPINNYFNEPKTKQSKPSNILKPKGRQRKTFTTEQQNNKKRIKCSELEYGHSETIQNLLTKSILPDVYPAHFKYQLPPEAVLNRPLVPYPITITPENTPLYQLDDSSSTSPSLPDSLRGIFDTDDIKEILNIDKVSYRLYDYHVQALAVILNLRSEYLCEILDKILQMNSNVLKTVDKAMKMPFVEDRDLFETTPDESPISEDIVLNSQSPKDRKLFTQTKLNLRK